MGYKPRRRKNSHQWWESPWIDYDDPRNFYYEKKTWLNGLKDRSPIKLIVDTDLKTPLDSILVENAKNDLIIFTNTLNDNKINSYEKKGIKIIHIKKNNKGYLKIGEILSFLNKMNINRLLIEESVTIPSFGV